MQVCDYVKYKGVVFIIIKKHSNTTWKIRNEDNCFVVLETNLETTNLRPAKLIEYGDTNYIVTGKGTIISVKTGKIMKWDDTHRIKKELTQLYSHG